MTAFLRKRGGGSRWWVHFVYIFADGRKERVRKPSPVDTRIGAEQYERQLRRVMQEQSEPRPKEVRSKTVAQFSEAFLAYSKNNNKPSSLMAKEVILRKHLLPSFGASRLHSVSQEAVESYKAKKVVDGYSAKTVNCHLAVLRKLLNLAKDWGEVASVPKLLQLRLQTPEVKFLTYEEASRLMHSVAPEWLSMVGVALKTGLRVGELLALQWEDVDATGGRLIVRRSAWQGKVGTTKSHRQRVVPLSATASALLARQRHRKGPFVFCRPSGEMFSHSEVKRVVPAACAAAKLSKRLTWHGLRHTFASHLVMLGTPLATVRELMGHSTFEMTLRYAHLTPDSKRDAVQVLDRHDTHTTPAQTTSKTTAKTRFLEREKRFEILSDVAMPVGEDGNGDQF